MITHNLSLLVVVVVVVIVSNGHSSFNPHLILCPLNIISSVIVPNVGCKRVNLFDDVI